MTDLNWDEIKACYGLGSRLKEEGDLAGAEECFRRILDLDPELPDPHHALGVVLQLQGKLREAVGHYKAAVTLDPLFVKAHFNLAVSQWRSGAYPDAMDSLRKTIDCAPDHREAHWLYGMLLLLTGNFANGWQEYEWRWGATGGPPSPPELGRPEWDGSPLDGRTLLIHMEQGRGDMIQFVRYASLAAASGGKVIVCALAELTQLLSTAAGVSQAVDRNGHLPEFDLQIPVLSLPRVMGTTLETIPANVPYIRPAPGAVADWKRKLGSDPPGFRVGLVWSGNEQPDSSRSCPLGQFASLFELQGVRFYSLQVGEQALRDAGSPYALALIDHTADIKDFSDTAAFVANLDLVISIDTAVAHLAGALGKRVWTLLPFVPDWRWMLERSDSPWYPTMRLYRQLAPDDWTHVIELVFQDLKRMPADLHGHPNEEGIKLMAAGQVAAAAEAFALAIAADPGNADAHCNRGVALDAMERYDEALDSYRQALSLRPDYVQALFNMGNTYRSLHSSDGARACYQRVAEMAPDFLPAHLCLGEIAKEERNFAEARLRFEETLRLEPGCAEALQGIGEIQQATEDFPGAIETYEHILALEPDRPATLNMLGTTYHSLERLAEAEACYRRATLLAPGRPTVLNNLGAVLHAQGDPHAAVEVFTSIIDRFPDNAEAHWNLALALLAVGRFKEGWQEYEWRFWKVNPVPEREYHQPRWDGSPLQERTVLVWCEQGFGDTLQFSRYVPLVAQSGGRVVLECQVTSLKRLLCSLEGVAEVVVTGDPLPPFDCHVPLLSLPLLFGTTFENMPAGVPYLYAEQTDIKAWHERLGPSAGFRVGLVWSGRQGQVLNRKRSCPLEMFAPLAALRGVELYSLQVGEGSENFTTSLAIIDLTGHIHDFADTAAFMANLDLVITIDTAVAHLAGALGVRTWTLLPYSADWRWFLHRPDSPWYPSMQLFRQSAVGDWSSVVSRIAELLGRDIHGDSMRESSLRSCNVHVADYGTEREASDALAVRRVGLAWSGRQDNPLNRKRSCPFSSLAPLFELPNIDFFSLQLGSENGSGSYGANLIDLTGNISDFEDTAALMANLDLVITIDTAVAHLAGAMGLPTWVLLPHVADWRWLLSRDDSPWYPSCMHLFRQPDHGDWESVVRKVAAALAGQTGRRSARPELVMSPLYSEVRPERLLLEQLLEKHQEYLAEHPSNPTAHLDVGAALALLGRHEESISYFRKTLDLAPELVTAHLDLAYALLTLGEYREGWMHLEWRLRRIATGQIPPWPMLGPKEFGSHSRGTSVLVHCEQGFGDTIQFARFLPMLADAGYKVIVSCQPQVATLVNSVRGVTLVVPHGQPLPLCDLQLLMLSLPHLVATTLETLPSDLPYLCPLNRSVEEWRRRLFNQHNFL